MLLGAALAPLIGGMMAHYYSWRGIQYGLCGFAVFSLILTLLLQPETSQPGARGIDKARSAGKKDGWVWLNPLRSLALLKSPNVLFLVCTRTSHAVDPADSATGDRRSICASD